MMPILAVRVGVFGLAAVIAGCALNGDSGSPDSSPAQDAPISCFLSPSYEPAEPIAGPGQVVRANANATGLLGFVTYQWSVQFAGEAVATTPASADGRDITFTVDRPGPYDVVLTVVGQACAPFVGAVNARDPDAEQRTWRLVITPANPALAPPQARTVLIPGGADFDVGSIAIDPGQRITGSLSIDGQPASGYLRLSPVIHPEVPTETFAQDGAYAIRALAVPTDVFVVPSSNAAPALISGWNIGNTHLPLTSGRLVSGTVTAVGEGAVGGASVVLRVNGVPSAIGTTAADGSFSLRARDGAAVDVIVTPPAGSGRARLMASLAAPDLSAPLTISFAATARRSLGGVRVVTAGSPAAAARLRVIANLPAAGTIAFGATSTSAAGAFIADVTADGSGHLPPLLAPASPLTVAVIAALSPNPGAAVAVNLTNSVPSEIAVPAPSALTTRVLDRAGAAIAGARIIATPTMAEGLLPILSGQTSSDGRIAISVAPGVSYQLWVSDPSLRRANRQAGPASAGAVAAITLDNAIRVRGRLTHQDAPHPFASIAAYCSDCPPAQQRQPAFEGATDAAGRFALAIPDPGIR